MTSGTTGGESPAADGETAAAVAAAPPALARAGAIARSLPFRAAVTLLLLGLVASKVDWAAMRDRVAAGDAGWLAVAVVLLVAALAVGVLRWWRLLGPAGVPLAGRDAGRIYAVSTFSSTFLPTSVGGDVARALLVTRDRRMLVRVALTIVVDRTGALLGLLLLAWGGLVLRPDAASDDARVALAAVTAAVVLGSAVALFAATRLGERERRRLPRVARAVLAEIRDVLAIYGRRPLLLTGLIASSVLFQVLVAAQLWAVAESLGVRLSFVDAAVTLALVTVAQLIPVSIAGFGIREGSYVLLLGSIGINATDATAISLGTVVVLLVASIPGAILLVRRGVSPVLA